MVASARDTRFAQHNTELRQALSIVRRVVRNADPGQMAGEQAMALSEQFAELEKMAGAGLSRLTPRVIETGVFTKEGHGSAQEWLGTLTGSSCGAAKSRLTAAERAVEVPELSDALKAGALSVPELSLVAKAAAADPEAVDTLLGMIDEGASHQELNAEAEAAKAAARSREEECARRARVHAGRHLRWHQCDGGGVRGEFFLDERQWAKVAPRIEHEARARWRAVGADDRDGYDAHRLDALIDLLSRSGSKDVSARPQCLVIVDAAALRRGSTKTGEICEIDGIGPVPVEAAVELLGEGAVQFIVREGKDIRTVTSSSRDLAQKTAIALTVRDRVCAVPGCGKRHGLEADHILEYRAQGPTTLDNLVMLCPEHHAMKTYGKWEISGQPGRWKWTPPQHPPSSGAIARTRRVTAAKAEAGLRPVPPLRR